MKSLLVLSPGALTTIQDLGRNGFTHMGIPQSGALDHEAAIAANALLGNPPEAAVLECTVVGPRLALLKTVKLAIAGADMQAALNNIPLPNWTAFRASPGDMLTFGQIKSGCRAYLAISGGFNVPMVMGSMSTYLAGKLGGFYGRPLMQGDFLDHFEYIPQMAPIFIPSLDQPRYSSPIKLRVLIGPQFDHFGANARHLFRKSFQVSGKADRSGYRLNGPYIFTANGYDHTIINEPVVRGTIQIPRDGQPIVLWGEQTVGGYAKIGSIIAPDLSRLAQAIPGDTIHFERIDLERAHNLYREWYFNKINLAKKLLDNDR